MILGENAMNILISVDETYLTISKTMLYSLFKNTNETINCYVLAKDVSSKNKIAFIKSTAGYIENVYFIDLNMINLGELKTNKHYSTAMYGRLFAQFLLPEGMDRILYLDADIIVKHDCSNFYNQNFEDKLIIACNDKDYNSEEIEKLKAKLDLSLEYKYFNSGVLLLNLKKLRKETKAEEIYRIMLQLQNKVEYPDQDILNVLYSENVKYNDNKYNYQVLKNDIINHIELENACILHYVGYKKPWSYKGINSFISRYYWKYRIGMNPINIFHFIVLKIVGAIYDEYLKFKGKRK